MEVKCSRLFSFHPRGLVTKLSSNRWQVLLTNLSQVRFSVGFIGRLWTVTAETCPSIHPWECKAVKLYWSFLYASALQGYGGTEILHEDDKSCNWSAWGCASFSLTGRQRLSKATWRRLEKWLNDLLLFSDTSCKRWKPSSSLRPLLAISG